MGPKKLEHTNGLQKHTTNNIEISRAPLDRVKRVLTVGNYEIKTSNDNGIKYHESHCTSSELQAMSKEIFKTEMLLQPPPPPPEPPHKAPRPPQPGTSCKGWRLSEISRDSRKGDTTPLNELKTKNVTREQHQYDTEEKGRCQVKGIRTT